MFVLSFHFEHSTCLAQALIKSVAVSLELAFGALVIKTLGWLYLGVLTGQQPQDFSISPQLPKPEPLW